MVSVCAKKSLNHEQQRRIELKCIELEAMLEEQGYIIIFYFFYMIFYSHA
jgi:hypothetical protein